MIPEIFSELQVLHQSFWYLAFFASLIFTLQMVLTFIGADSGGHDGAVMSGDGDHMDAPLELFTLRNLINFLLGFGWTGVVFYGKMPDTFLIILATTVGIVFVAMFFFIIKQILKLQEDNTLKLDSAIGKTAQVYINIPPFNEGSGKVQLSINGSFHELEAVTEDQYMINSGDEVEIINIENNILIVEKILKA